MTLGQHEIKRHPLLATVLQLQQAEHYREAGQMLASQDAYFYDQTEMKVLYGLLTKFPPAFIEQTPDLWYLQALLYRRMGQFQQAVQRLTSAKDAYAAAHQHQGVIHCTLEVARIAHQNGDVPHAMNILHGEVQPLLDQFPNNASTVLAHFSLQMADGYLAHGVLSTAIYYAQQALTLYTSNGYGYGQVLAELWLARLAVNAGEYAKAQRHLEHAQQQRQAAPLGALAEARLLHIQLLLTWYQRSLEEGLQIAESYLSVADAEPYGIDRLEARLLLGNIYRDLRQYRTAASWYAETNRMIEQLGYAAYSPRLQIESAWLHILEGQLSAARALIDEPQQQAQESVVTDHEPGQQAPHTPVICDCQTDRHLRQVVSAVLHMLDGEWAQADALIHAAMPIYEKRGDLLVAYTLRLYLAYSALHQEDPTTTLRQLGPSIEWLATHEIATFPYWWHPKILAQVCTHALLCDFYPEFIEQILVKHLGKASLPALKLLEKTDDIELRRRVYRMQQMITGVNISALDEVRESPNRQVIQELLSQGELCAENYPALEQELMTAHNRHHPNPTIIAVFGLYIKGQTRSEIAKTLVCSLENVRNYITVIYHHFDLPLQRFQSRSARKQKLIEVARARGFIY